MLMERCEQKCRRNDGVRHRKSSIRLPCSASPTITSVERREKERELQRVRDEMKNETNELRDIRVQFHQILEDVEKREQGLERLQREYEDSNRQYQCLHMQNQRERSRYQSLISSKAQHLIDESSIPTTEELTHATRIVSFGV